MALNKVAATKLGKFGSLTSAGHAKADNSIFGKNACNTVCSYQNSFNDITAGDNGAFDIFSKKGMDNINKEIDIMTGKDKQKSEPKNFQMNAKSLLILQKELGMDNSVKRVTLNS